MAVDRDKFSNHPDCPERPCRPRNSRPTPLPKLRAAISPDAPRGCGSLGAPKSLHRPAPAPPPRPPPTTPRLQGSVSLSLPRPHLFSGPERGARCVGVGSGGGVAVRPLSGQPSLSTSGSWVSAIALCKPENFPRSLQQPLVLGLPRLRTWDAGSAQSFWKSD